MPRENLFNAVWGSGFIGESRTLDMHIRTLRAKLGDNTAEPRYIKTVRGVGYRFIATD
jgi:two-component system alkaline phosphatase synthesis response regulator PhoP